MKTGILIINIGTPASPSIQDVGDYLKKFLMDEDVIALPYVFRWLLVHMIIVPFRAVKSAAKYAKIWTPAGSPLKVNTSDFIQKLQISLGQENYIVKMGMAFSEPSIENSLLEFKNEPIDNIIICPMFPQYAEATTGSVIKCVKKILSSKDIQIKTSSIKPFYNQDFYLQSIVEKCPQIYPEDVHWLFSYHGLPEKQITRNSECQLSSDCCLSQKNCTLQCYRSHCFKTTQQLVQKLNLKESDYAITFQSRLGVKRWLQPYTDEVLKALPTKNKKTVIIVSPAFVADCLETLEEINLESRHLFLSHGGKNFEYIPCINSDKNWVDGFANYITKRENTIKLN